MRALPHLLAGAVLAVAAAGVAAVESDPLPVPRRGAGADAVLRYNEGVAMLAKRQFAQAQARFEAALSLDDTLAEAHNNLAYALRMQGRQNFRESLAHYDRALALKPGLAQAYMYRGALFVQQGDMDRARRDLDKLRTLNSVLAAELERIVNGAVEGDARGGIAAQFEY